MSGTGFKFLLYTFLVFLIKQFTFERVIHVTVQCSKGVKGYTIKSTSLIHP